jgi:hypothetical protein
VVIREIIDKQGNRITKHKEIIEYLAKGQSEILTSTYNNPQYLHNQNYDKEIMEEEENNEYITEIDFEYMLKKLKSTSPGISKITGNMIRNSKQYHPQILKCFNIFYLNKDIPNEWRDSIIKLIHKKGDTSNFENYRPIALLEVLYKSYPL